MTFLKMLRLGYTIRLSDRLLYFINRENCLLLNPCRSFAVKNCSSRITCDTLKKDDLYMKNNLTTSIHCRYKSKEKKKKLNQRFLKQGNEEDDEEEDDDDEDPEDDELLKQKGTEVKTYSLETLRVDSLLKAAFGYNRKVIEKSFYENKIRLNGRIISKKSINAHLDDQIDLIKHQSSENPNFLVVSRVEVLKISADTENEKILVKVRKSKSLTIENYVEGDIWKPSEAESEN